MLKPIFLSFCQCVSPTLLELFLSPDVLVNAVGEIISPRIQSQSHWRLRDPLIQQMTLALKTELELAGEDSKLYADSIWGMFVLTKVTCSQYKEQY